MPNMTLAEAGDTLREFARHRLTHRAFKSRIAALVEEDRRGNKVFHCVTERAEKPIHLPEAIPQHARYVIRLFVKDLSLPNDEAFDVALQEAVTAAAPRLMQDALEILTRRCRDNSSKAKEAVRILMGEDEVDPPISA